MSLLDHHTDVAHTQVVTETGSPLCRNEKHKLFLLLSENQGVFSSHGEEKKKNHIIAIIGYDVKLKMLWSVTRVAIHYIFQE